MNLILQDQQCGLLAKYITEGDDYVDWLQWAAIKELENLKGCSINVPIINPVHLDDENMQQVHSFGDEKWDEIRSKIKFN
jgi:hypothetical protein